MLDFEQLMRMAIESHASDLHLSSGRAPSCRIYGVITSMSDEKLTPTDIEDIAKSIMNPSQVETLQELGEVEIGRAHV